MAYIWSFTTVLALTPSTVESNGGYRIVVTGLSTLPDGAYFIHTGPLGSAADPRCYAGAHGTGDVVNIEDGAGSFVSPPLPTGGPYRLHVIGLAADVLTSGQVLTTYPILTIVGRNHRSRTYALRSALLSWWATGPRRIVDEELQP